MKKKFKLPKYKSPMTEFRQKIETKLKIIFPGEFKYFREALWDIRYWVLAIEILSLIIDINTYMKGECGLLSLIAGIALKTMWVLVPFAYGINPSKKEEKKK